MTFFAIALLAGFLTVLAPCILPLLPIVIGAAEQGARGISRRALTIIASLSVSVILFTLLLKATTLLIFIPQSFWQYFSGTVLILAGLAIVFPDVWTRVPFVARLGVASNRAVGAGYQERSPRGDILIGAALGPVFTTCSPTYLFIIATILPASFAVGLVYLTGFVIGLSLALLAIAYFGERLTAAIGARIGATEYLKRAFGILIILVGVAIMTGYDKKIETAILDAGYGATIEFEDTLIESSGIRDIMNMQSDTMNTPMKKIQDGARLETLTLAGGCFWCIEGALQGLPGVVGAVSGYAGGGANDATYLSVSKGTTGHREAVQITYDPSVLSTDALLNKFWASIDPTDAGGAIRRPRAAVHDGDLLPHRRAESHREHFKGCARGERPSFKTGSYRSHTVLDILSCGRISPGLFSQIIRTLRAVQKRFRPRGFR